MTLTAEVDAPRPDEDMAGGAGRPARWLRGLLLLVLGAAFVPSVLPFSVELSEEERVCVPIVNGWHRDREKPSDADFQEVVDSFAHLPSPEAMRDPAQRAAWLAADAERSSTPGYRRATSYLDWIDGPGACVPESRHRLIVTGAGLAGVLGLTAVATVASRGRHTAA